VGERLARTLLDGAARDGRPVAGFLRREKLTHKELAARIGSSREAVSKCMKVLVTKGIVMDSEGSVLIAENALDQIKNRAVS